MSRDCPLSQTRAILQGLALEVFTVSPARRVWINPEQGGTGSICPLFALLLQASSRPSCSSIPGTSHPPRRAQHGL